MPGEQADVHLSVRARLRPGEQLLLVGAPDALGAWDVERAMPLASSAAAYPLFQATVSLPCGEHECRFVVRQPPRRGPVDMRRRDGWEYCWEAPVRQPARVITVEPAPAADLDCGWFGVETDADGVRTAHTDHRWLVRAHQLRLTPGLRGSPAARARLPALEGDFDADDVELQLWGPVTAAEVNELRDPDHTWAFARAAAQERDVAFNCLDPAAAFFVIKADDATALLSPGALHGERGRVSAPLMTRDGRVRGTTHFEYVWFRPFGGIGLRRLWSLTPLFESTRLVDIAHRGLGSSLNVVRPSAAVRVAENTVLSFNAAAPHAAFVEFDVQVTKEGAVVVFHDFQVCVNVSPPLYKAVSALSLDEFRSLAAVHSGATSRRARSSSTGDDLLPVSDDADIHRSHSSGALGEGDLGAVLQDQYCTLEEAFANVEPAVGFVVELKWPCPVARAREAMLVPDVGTYVDAVLDVVSRCAGGRRVVLQAYSPLLCAACNVKQAQYPVFYICDAWAGSDLPADLRDDDVDLADERCVNIDAAIDFAVRENLRGLTLAAKNLLRAPGLIRKIKDAGLLLFSYGPENQQADDIVRQKTLGVDCVIGDNIAGVRRAAPSTSFRLRREFTASAEGEGRADGGRGEGRGEGRGDGDGDGGGARRRATSFDLDERTVSPVLPPAPVESEAGGSEAGLRSPGGALSF